MHAGRVPYTVVGGTRKDRIRKYSARLTVLILSRLGRLYKEDFLEELGGLEHADVLCVEGPGRTYDLEGRARKFPRCASCCSKRTSP